MRKLFITGFYLVYCAWFIAAQNSVQGTITDLNNGNFLLGATVYIPEIHKGTVADTSGYYLLQGIPDGHFNIQFSYMGYKTHVEHIDVRCCDQVLNIGMQPTAITAQEVIITGGRTCTQHENAIKIEQIRMENISNNTETHLMEKLATLPGVDAVTKGSGIATPVIRGLSTSNIVLLNNGVRMENYQFSTNHPYLINESSVHSVEIIKGPASLLYGSDAVGGVMNFIKEKPAPVNSIKGSIYSEYNSNYRGYKNRASIKTSKENIYGGIWLSQGRSQDYYSGDGRDVPNSRNTMYSVKANTGFRFKKGLTQISYDYNKLTPGLVISQAVTEVTANEYKNRVWYQNLDNHTLTSNTTLFLNRLKFNFDLSYQFNKRQLKASELTPEYTMVNMDLHSYTYQLKSRYHFSQKNNLIIAFQGLYQRNINDNVPLRVLPDYTALSNSVAGVWQYNLSPKLFYQLGLRYDNKIYDVPEQTAVDKGDYSFKHLSPIYNNFSFSTGLTYKLSNPLLIRANLASAYRTPSIAELTQDGIHANRYERGNSNLNTQQNIEGDVSMHYHSDKLKLELAGFCNNISGYIYLAPTPDTTNAGLDIYQYRQNEASIYGFEADLEWKPVSFFKVIASYAHLKAQRDDGSYLPFIPQDKIDTRFVFIVTGTKRISKMEIACNPRYAFRQDTPHEFEQTTDPYFLLNAYVRATFKLNKQEITGGVYAQNLFDEVYFDHLSTISNMGYYNMGRNIRVSVNIPLTIKQ